MKVVICGSRYAGDDHRELIFNTLDDLHEINGFTEVISGGARGADAIGEQWAWRNRIPIVRKEAQWQIHGKAAGPYRNQEMADMADACVAFPLKDGSTGTRDMITRALRGDLSVVVVEISHGETHEGGEQALDEFFKRPQGDSDL